MVTRRVDGTSTDRVAIVTGGSHGIGREITRKLASRGYAVVVNYARNQAAADATVETILAANGTALTVRADVADELDVERLFIETVEAFGPIDVVVHAAGLVHSPLAALDLDGFDDLCRANVRGTFLVNRQALRQVRDGGAIVNLSRPVVGSDLSTSAASAASKAAAEAMTRVLARQLRRRDITVNAVALGHEDSGDTKIVADLVAFLVSDDGHGLSGHVLPVAFHTDGDEQLKEQRCAYLWPARAEPSGGPSSLP